MSSAHDSLLDKFEAREVVWDLSCSFLESSETEFSSARLLVLDESRASLDVQDPLRRGRVASGIACWENEDEEEDGRCASAFDRPPLSVMVTANPAVAARGHCRCNVASVRSYSNCQGGVLDAVTKAERC